MHNQYIHEEVVAELERLSNSSFSNKSVSMVIPTKEMMARALNLEVSQIGNISKDGPKTDSFQMAGVFLLVEIDGYPYYIDAYRIVELYKEASYKMGYSVTTFNGSKSDYMALFEHQSEPELCVPVRSVSMYNALTEGFYRVLKKANNEQSTTE